MPGNAETYQANFRVALEGLEQARKQLEELLNTPGLEMRKTLRDAFKDILASFPGFRSQVEKEFAKTDLSQINFNDLNKNFRQLASKLEGAFRAVLKSSVTKDISTTIDEMIAKINSLRGTLGARVKEANQLSQRVRDGQLTDSRERSKLFIQGAKQAGVRGGVIKYEEGDTVKVISSYEELIARQDEFREKLGETSAEWAQYQQVIKNVEELMNQRVQEIEARLAQLNQQSAPGGGAPAGVSEADYSQSIAAAREALQQEQQALSNYNQTKQQSNATSEQEKTILNTVTQALNGLTTATGQAADATRAAQTEQKGQKTAVKDTTTEIKNLNIEQEKNTTTLGRAAQQVLTYGTAIRMLRMIYRATINTITEMDKALTSMAVVTTMSREQTWALVGSFQSLSRATGKTTSEIASMATKFYQQGKSTTQVLQLTEAAAKAATIAGIDGAESINLLTNALNGFQMSASQAMEVSDKFAALAASAATDYEELATALSKVAAQANLAGLSMDFTLGLLTKGIETTREAPETIGTALKTVLSRMRELTDYGKTLEDGMDVNRVAKALDNIGISLMNTNGQFRDMESVLKDVGAKWDDLNTNQQANVAVALAGTRCRREMACAWAA